MAKHVFEYAYGRLAHRGAIVKETPKTFVLSSPTSRGGEYRLHKSRGMIVRETSKPEAVITAFTEKLASHGNAISCAKDELAALQRMARASAFRAAGMDDPYADD